MKQIHNQEKDQFKLLFQQENIDRFEDRFTILEIFLKTERHITTDELIDLLAKNGQHFDPDFVRETLRLMCQFGFARKNRFDNGRVRYEHNHLGQHHDHMICTKCGDIIEFINDRLEDIQKQVTRDHGFHMLQHRMEIYGICDKCLSQHIRLLTLASAKPGERLVVRSLPNGAGARIRLLSMGIRLGDDIDVISNLSKGQVVIALGTNRFVLGKGLAEKIEVERKTGNDMQAESDENVTESLPIPMSEMREGQKGTIARVGGNGALRRRLLEMGLTSGSNIRIEKYAPLKDPLELIVKGYHVSLRVEEAAQITVNNVS